MKSLKFQHKDGVTDIDALKEIISDDDTAGVIVQYPNFFGQIEAVKRNGRNHLMSVKSMFIVSSNPLALGALTPPGKFGADIVVGDAQPFGIPDSIWWTTLWLFCSNEQTYA